MGFPGLLFTFDTPHPHIWSLQGWISDILFLALVAVSVARFLAILVGRVAVKGRFPTVVNYLMDPALILPLMLIVVGPTLQIPILALPTSLKRLFLRSKLQRS